MQMRIAKLVIALFTANLAIGILGATELKAETGPWPRRPVRVVTPFGAGTANDISARYFADRLAKRWSQPVAIENRPGADTVVGVGAFVSAQDDHTLLFSTASSVTLAPLMNDKLPYDPSRDLAPISTACDTTIVIAAAASSNILSLADLVSRVRAEPGKLLWASGPSLPKFLFEAFLKSHALDMVYVPYKETTPQLTDLGEGRIHVVITGLVGALPVHKTGKARFLAVTNSERAASFPNIPTVREAGQPSMSADGLSGFFGWRDMPVELRNRIAADLRTIALDSELKSRLESIGQTLRVGTPAEFAAAIEVQRLWATETAKIVNFKTTQ
jgi:tripartite-type tricarboxylate transporter receptor subunit TctC